MQSAGLIPELPHIIDVIYLCFPVIYRTAHKDRPCFNPMRYKLISYTNPKLQRLIPASFTFVCDSRCKTFNPVQVMGSALSNFTKFGKLHINTFISFLHIRDRLFDFTLQGNVNNGRLPLFQSCFMEGNSFCRSLFALFCTSFVASYFQSIEQPAKQGYEQFKH